MSLGFFLIGWYACYGEGKVKGGRMRRDSDYGNLLGWKLTGVIYNVGKIS